MTTIIIQAKIPSWNALARKHYRVVMAIYKTLSEATGWATISQKVKPIKEYPVELEFHAKWKKNYRRDIDQLCVKPITDTLVATGILKDDDISHVARCVFTGEIGAEEDELRICINPYEDKR